MSHCCHDNMLDHTHQIIIFLLYFPDQFTRRNSTHNGVHISVCQLEDKGLLGRREGGGKRERGREEEREGMKEREGEWRRRKERRRRERKERRRRGEK